MSGPPPHAEQPTGKGAPGRTVDRAERMETDRESVRTMRVSGVPRAALSSDSSNWIGSDLIARYRSCGRATRTKRTYGRG